MTMNRTFLARAFVVSALLGGSALGAFGTDRARAAGGQVKGTFVMTFHLTTTLPDGTSVSATPLISPTDTVYSDGTSGFTSATVASGKATLSIRIPYSWRVSSTSDQVSITTNVYGYASTSTANLSNSTYFTSTITLPADGATTPISYTGTL